MSPQNEIFSSFISWNEKKQSLDSLNIFVRVVRYFGKFIFVILSPSFVFCINRVEGNSHTSNYSSWSLLCKKHLFQSQVEYYFLGNFSHENLRLLKCQDNLSHCCCSSELLPAFEQRTHKAKSRLRKKPTYRPWPFCCGADTTQSPRYFLREAEQISIIGQPMVLRCLRSGARWRFSCWSLRLTWALISEEHKYFLWTYWSGVTRDHDVDLKGLYCSSNSFSYTGILGKVCNYWYLSVLLKINYIIFRKSWQFVKVYSLIWSKYEWQTTSVNWIILN